MDLFPDHPRFESERFIIRAILESEIDSLFPLGLAAWDGKPATTLEDARISVRKTAREYAAGQGLHWIVESKADQKIVGCIGFYRGFTDGRGEIGYAVTPAFRKQKVMTEVLPRVLEFAYKVKGLAKVVAVTGADNAPSINLLQRCGFRMETELPEGQLQFGRASR